MHTIFTYHNVALATFGQLNVAHGSAKTLSEPVPPIVTERLVQQRAAEEAEQQERLQMEQEEKAEQLSKSQRRQKAYMEKQRLAAEAGPTD